MNKEEEIKDSIEFCEDIYMYYEKADEEDVMDGSPYKKSYHASLERRRRFYSEPNKHASYISVLEDEEGMKKKAVAVDCFQIFLCIVLAFFTAKLVSSYVLQITEVHGESMAATVSNGDRLFVDKLTYQWKDPERFDIVVLSKDNEVNLIKRVIGLPGETVEIREGKIYINGIELVEHYGLDPINPYAEPVEMQLGEEEFFVLGDNRLISLDSRYPEVGAVRKDEIIGEAFLRIYPLSKVDWLLPKDEES